MIKDLDMRSGMVVILSLIMTACGSDSNSSNEQALCTELDPCNTTMVFETAYKSRVDSLVRDAVGSTCYIVREYDREDGKLSLILSDWAYRLECINNQGEFIQKTEAASGHMFRELLLTDNNQLFFTEFSDLAKTEERKFDGFTLQFHLQNMSGDLVSSKILTDKPTEAEMVEYDLDFDTDEIVKTPLTGSLHGEDIPVLLDAAEVYMQWHEGKLHLLATTYGLKYYRLNADLELEADVNILPVVPLMWDLGSTLDRMSAMTVMDDGKVAIAVDVSSERVRYVNDFFGTSFEVKKGDQLITMVHPDESVERFVVGNQEEQEFIVGLESIGDTLWLAANIRPEKENAAGGTTEWDVALMSINTQTKEIDQYFNLHDSKEDIALDFRKLNDDLFLISGWNGFVQVNTNSIVSNGQGFNWVVNQSGQIVDKELVEGARDTAVRKASITPDNKILIAKEYDRPITHTCDNDPEDRMCFDKVMIEESILSF